jgi:NADH:ubiquinone oxidoreductase subunit 5 (subunit L)/multisubunit Na+/H+ antiporter MnhA subunit
MYLTLLALPLSTFCCLALFGRFIGPRGCILLSGFSSISCTLISIVIFYQVASVTCHISLAPFFIVNYTTPTGVLFDTLTAVCLVVTLVSCLVVYLAFLI